jgi:DNA-binding FadR family transcriptional regulator
MSDLLASAAPVRRPRLYEEIAARLSALILDGGIPVGGRLPAEAEIARRLGVSRPAVREAIVALETAGIVIARSGGGLFVLRRPRRGAALSFGQRGDPGPGPREQLRARQLVEPEIAAEAARVASPARIEALDQAARAIAAAAAAGLPFAEDAVEWHVALAEAAGIAPLAELMPKLLDSTHHAMWRTIRARSETDERCAARTGVRERLVGALRVRDAEAARRIMREHLDAVAAAVFGVDEA